MLLPELARLLKQVELKPSLKTMTKRSGAVRRNRSGRGMDFKEVRNYIFGDDTRHIDWNVTSRMGELYVKEFHVENDQLINIFLDVSKSMYTGAGEERSKFFVGYQIAFFIALLCIFAGEQVNIVCYSKNIEFSSGVLKTREAVYYAFSKIAKMKPLIPESSHRLPFSLLKDKYIRKSITYIISDFYNIEDISIFKSLIYVHDIYAVSVFDPIETIENELFSLFYIKNPETLEGGKYLSTYREDSKIVFSFFGSKLLRIGTNEELGIPVMNFIQK
jgi:uncharacterized protein (DUF58 family)